MSPRIVKCRFLSLSITTSPRGGEKVGEQLHSTANKESPTALSVIGEAFMNKERDVALGRQTGLAYSARLPWTVQLL